MFTIDCQADRPSVVRMSIVRPLRPVYRDAISLY